MDLFGPVNVISMSKKRYALVIVDDYSKYTWVLFLYSKDETPRMVIDHVKLIELDSQCPVRARRSDNGTEFKNAILNDFYAEKKDNKTVLSAQNSLVEWSSRKEKLYFN